ncbi:hypothetical protein KEJ13_09150, partial [Candidatus Bathyarchaeota archaeon]|nr:hypothetical protein [Candidatus Bathyarchaeota archaeon]
MSRRLLAVFPLLLVLTMSNMVFPANGEGVVVVAVDLSHGESDKYLSFITGNITFVEWRTITEFNAASL